MRVAQNDSDDRAGMCGCVQFNTYTYIHTYIHTYINTYIHTYILHTYVTGPDCVVMCNLINIYIHTYIHTYIHFVAFDQRFS